MKHFWMKRMDAMANGYPGLYYLTAWLLAVIGYGYLILFPLLVVTPIAYTGYRIAQVTPVQWSGQDWLIALVLLVISALAAWTTRAIATTRPELPAGKPLTANDYPALNRYIKQLETTYDAPALHQIKLTARFGIEIIQSPVHGFPASYHYTLLIGLPVMLCMSEPHLKLLLAREIGHLAVSRKRYNRRIVYLRSVWQQYALEYSHDWKPETLLLRLFFSWYAPLFSATTASAVILEEFIKDSCMLDVAAADKAAEAIAVFAIKQRFIDREFWPELNDMAYTQPRPGWLPYSTMDSKLAQKLDREKIQAYYNDETGQYAATDMDTTLLHQRMKQLGQDEFVIPAAQGESAATHFLGESLEQVQSQMDNIWYLKNKEIWRKRYQQGINEKKQLKQLRERAAQALLSNEEAHHYVLLLQKYIEPQKSRPLLYEILKTNSHDPYVCFEVGCLLLKSSDGHGVDALEIAMDMTDDLTVECCQQIVKYMVDIGDMNKAQIYRRKILTHQVEA